MLSSNEYKKVASQCSHFGINGNVLMMADESEFCECIQRYLGSTDFAFRDYDWHLRTMHRAAKDHFL